MKLKTLMLLFSWLILFITACNSEKKKVVENKIVYDVPKGTIELSDNFFVDTCEIRNHDYLEYLFWTKRIYGESSAIFRAALPDSTVWNEFPGFYFAKDYLWFCRDCPVVGITYQQAINYSKWRSDRVLQMILVDKKILSWNDQEDSTNYFSIDKYYEGKYLGIKPDLNILFPEYGLPTIDEWNSIMSKTDAFNKNDVYLFGKKSGNGDEDNIINTSDNEKPKEGKDMIYTVAVYKDPKSKIIFHLYDNVSEISKDKGVALGGNWYLANKGIYGNIISSFDKPNAWTGFRNVCRWKKYNK